MHEIKKKTCHDFGHLALFPNFLVHFGKTYLWHLVLQGCHQDPDCVVVNGAEGENRPLGNEDVDVVDGGDQAAEGVGEDRLEDGGLLHRAVLQEAEQEGHLELFI